MPFKPLKTNQKRVGGPDGVGKYAYKTIYHPVITREGSLGQVSISVDSREEEGEIGQRKKTERGGLAVQYHIIYAL